MDVFYLAEMSSSKFRLTTLFYCLDILRFLICSNNFIYSYSYGIHALGFFLFNFLNFACSY